MADSLLVLNAGSSSLKFTVFDVAGDALQPQCTGVLEELGHAARFLARDAQGQRLGERQWPADPPLGHHGAIEALFDWLRDRPEGAGSRLIGVGHRVVHGGTLHVAPVRIDVDVLAQLRALVPLAPLHQPHNLGPIELIARRHPALPQVACFDTAFHHGAPPVSQAFALPPELTARGVRRYGFHGLSYEFIAQALAGHDPRAAAGRTVVLHLGNGASMCALDGGRSVASTMGFTALDGLPMGTRCGALDPGVVLYLMDELKMDARAIEALLYQRSGLLGVSGVSSDMRTLAESADPKAAEAIDLFVYRIGRELGSLAAALGGLDAIVFTAGIGEHSVRIRDAVCRRATWLGVELDDEANAGGGPRISTAGSRTAAWVIPTDEALMIARHTRRLLAA